jgi:hypothetical protein
VKEVVVTQDVDVGIASVVVMLDDMAEVIQTMEQGPPGPQGAKGDDGVPGVIHSVGVSDGLSGGGGTTVVNIGILDGGISDAKLETPKVSKAGDAMSGQLTVNATAKVAPPATDRALDVYQNPAGTIAGSAAALLLPGTLGVRPRTANTGALNQVSVWSDTLDAGTGFVDGLAIVHTFGGAAMKGGRQGLQVITSLDAPSAPTNSNQFYVGAMFLGQATSSDGGGVGSERGYVFATNPVVWLAPAAKNLLEASISEYNTQLEAGSSALNKYGLKIVQTSKDAVAGSRNDAAVLFSNQPSAVGWRTLIQVGEEYGATPLQTTGSILAVKSAPTITDGIDLTGATFLGSPFKSYRFSVGPDGSLTVGSLAASSSTTTGALTVAGGLGVSGMAYFGNQMRISEAVANGGTLLVSGPTYGVRIGTDVIGGVVEGVDKTGFGSFQPLKLGGSRVWADSTLASTSPTTGALTVAGGLGIGGNINAKDVYGTAFVSSLAATPATGLYYFGDAFTKYLQWTGSVFYLAGGPLNIPDTTASTSPTTGALKVAGGLGVGGDVRAQGNVYSGGTALTCFGMQYLKHGKVDLAQWDAVSPTGKHDLAHKFVEMLRDFDPRDPQQYVEQMLRNEALPGMPTASEWKPGQQSLDDMQNRLWLAVELLASAFAGAMTRIEALEKRKGK